MVRKRKWDEQILKEIIGTSESIADCLRKLNLRPLGSNYKTFKKYVKIFNLDTSHFLGLRSWKGKTRVIRKKDISEYLIKNSPLDPSTLKVRIIKENILPYKCDECGIYTWNNNNLVLHLDHINGVNNDHRLCNLRLLCPNCHSQTSTYCGRNKPNLKVPKIQNKCIDCNKNITKSSIRCNHCASQFQPTKIIWPDFTILSNMVKENGLSGTGKLLGVSDNAVKKRLKNHKD